ncbi:MAG: hypothetical protein KJ011_12750 [Burkholderiaceae bacterium]|nr:hypothetical protein [Burkholderiaceae bacterium]
MAGKLGIGELASMGLGNVGIGPLNVGSVLDTVDFVRKAWASFGVPSNFAPTVDLEELDKRIADLKAVEQWLTVNMNMLQGAIQALEIQRGTIATLKAFGAPVAAMAQAGKAAAGAHDAALSAWAGAASSAASSVALPQASSAPTVAAPTIAAPTVAAPDVPAAAASASAAPASPAGKRSRRKPRRNAQPDVQASAAFADPGLSPSAWWNLLQNQFNQVAATALSGVGLSRPQPDDGADKRATARDDASEGVTARAGARPPRKRAAGPARKAAARARASGPAR